jgi:hypothetical protein
MKHTSIILYLYMFTTWIPVISFGLVLFRFKIKSYFTQILFLSFIISTLCYYINVFEVSYLTMIFQPILFLLGYWLIFRINILHSMILALLLYLTNILMESMYAFVLGHLISDITLNNTLYLFVIGVPIFISNLMLCVLFIKYRIGFTFIPSNQYVKPRVKGNLKQLITPCAFGFISIGLTALSYYYENTTPILANSLVLLVLTEIIRRSLVVEI